jgi:uncharacterized membrane protein YdfJ with MMPL/SSD domain
VSEPETRGTAKRLALSVVAGSATGASITIRDEPVVFGRESSGMGSLSGDPELSREHARISPFEGGRLLVEDLGSTNGTFVNGGPIAGPTVVQAGDAIWLGGSTLLVRDSDEPAPVLAPTAPPTPSAEGSLLARIALLGARKPKRNLIILGVVFLLCAAIGGPISTKLHDNNGFDDHNSQNQVAERQLAQASGVWPGALMVAIVRPGAGETIDSPATKQRVQTLANNIAANSHIKRVLTYYGTGNPSFVSRDRSSTVVAAFFGNYDNITRNEVAEKIREKYESSPQVVFGAQAIVNNAVSKQSTKDLGKAESLAFPILLLVSLFVFRGLVAALLPLFVGIITIFATFLGLTIVDGIITVNVFALNIVTALGLGLAIDYSLFIVTRYREELARVGARRAHNEMYGATDAPPGEVGMAAFMGSTNEALVRTMMTAGRTILFSAATVTVAMLSLTVFPLPFLYSMGIGGALTTIMAVLTALLALPPLLALLGPRINSLSPKRWRRKAEEEAGRSRSGRWYGLSRSVMRRPGIVAIAAAALMISVGISVSRIEFTGTNARSLPTSLRAKSVSDTIASQYAVDSSAQIQIEISAPPTAGPQIQAYANQLLAKPDVATVLPAHYASDNIWEMDVQPWGNGLDTRTIQLAKDIRSGAKPFPIKIAGEAPQFVDEEHALSSSLPLALAILVIATVFVLFLMTGSVVLPIKSVLMNLLSICFTLGLLVIIFQDGHLQSALNFTSLGALDPGQPILICAIAFGLSTDYSVFLLGRISEARKQRGVSESEAVALGVERTGRIVTQAALLFCIAVLAFATSNLVFLKEDGIGVAAAVIVDSTIVRGLLVPSLMVMLGARNWWAPRALRRLHGRIGLSEA